MSDYNVKSIEATLWEIKDRDAHFPYLDGWALRQAWIIRVLDCCKAEDFKLLISKQLDLYCDYPRLDELMEACNAPKHLVRNRLITFEIDHPELFNFGPCEKCIFYTIKSQWCNRNAGRMPPKGKCSAFIDKQN